MRAIILAAGRGSRIGPLTEHIPKALLECGGQTLIERTIKTYIESGIEDITVGVGWKGHEVRDHIEQSFHTEAIRTVDVPNYMHGPLQTLVTSLESNNEPCLIGPVDSIMDSSIIMGLLESQKLQHSDLVIAIDRESSHGTDVFIDESGNITGVGIKRSGSYLGKSALLILVSQRFLELCADDLKKGEQKIASVINHAIEQGLSVVHAEITGEWFDIDSITDLLKANQSVLGRLEDPPENCVFIPEGDTLEIGNDLALDNDIHLKTGVHIIGTVVISAGCVIEDNSVIGPYVSLGSNSSVSAGCSIKESVIFNSARIKPGVSLSKVVVHGNEIYQE